MPNHVINELIFRNLSPHLQYEIKSNVVNKDDKIDFEILLPIPLNIWHGDVGSKHDKFPGNALDWARANWGTKWNAYGNRHLEMINDDGLILRFQTAWSPPYGWLVTIFNRFKVSFDHNWLDEGARCGISGKFDYPKMDVFGGDGWVEVEADDEMQKHLHKLLWGVESFEDEKEE